jgi:hypothetical protein
LIQSAGDIPCRGLENGDPDIAFMCGGVVARCYFGYTATKGGLASLVRSKGWRPEGVAHAQLLPARSRSLI